MQRYELGRQERGRLAEVLAAGLHKHPPEPLKTLVEGHTRECYRTLIRTRVKISNADITKYCWTDEVPVPASDDISRRPDVFLKSEWGVEYRRARVAEAHYPLLDWMADRSEHSFSIYYPVEVKSGGEENAHGTAVAGHPAGGGDGRVRPPDHPHTVWYDRFPVRPHEGVRSIPNCLIPNRIKIDIDDLPESYAMDAEIFSGPDTGGGETTRYQFRGSPPEASRPLFHH